MKWPVALLSALLVGCAGPADPEPGPGFTELHDACGERPEPGDGSSDWSKQTIDFYVTSDAPFTVWVPVMIADQGAEPDDWRPDPGSAGAWEPVDTPRGDAIEITGDEGRHLIGCTVLPASERGNGCCSETYLDGVWSMGPDEPRSGQASLRVVSGHVDVRLLYHAASAWCGRDAELSVSSAGPGWHTAVGEDSAWCE